MDPGLSRSPQTFKRLRDFFYYRWSNDSLSGTYFCHSLSPGLTISKSQNNESYRTLCLHSCNKICLLYELFLFLIRRLILFENGFCGLFRFLFVLLSLPNGSLPPTEETPKDSGQLLFYKILIVYSSLKFFFSDLLCFLDTDVNGCFPKRLQSFTIKIKTLSTRVYSG